MKSMHEGGREDAALYADTASMRVEESQNGRLIECAGDWSLGGIADIDGRMRDLERSLAETHSVTIDTSKVSKFDTSGAWLIARLQKKAAALEIVATHIDGGARHTQLVDVIDDSASEDDGRISSPNNLVSRSLERVGRFTTGLGLDILAISNMIGAAIRGPQMKAIKGRGLRIQSVVHQLDQMALRAVPVIAVMSFLIGAIIAQQGAFQLRAFGEELLTVNLVGILLLREIGVLLTAVMMAGRTGSAITAEIGTMKMREEVDALRVIGLNPIGVLVVPRLLALIIAMPILAFLADIMGLAGAIVVSWLYVGIPPEQFVMALREAIDLSTVFSGLIKAPFMAIVIALISANEGLKVRGSAESLGTHTTNAVVRSIFAVILLDGVFAIFYAAIDY